MAGTDAGAGTVELYWKLQICRAEAQELETGDGQAINKHRAQESKPGSENRD